MDLFGKEWTEAYEKQINADAEYHENGKGWLNPIRFISIDGDQKKAVWLDLKNGICEQSLSGEAALTATSSYEIQAENKVWEHLLATKGDPLVALLTGKLKLTKGSLFTLSRYTASAKDLVRLASSVEIFEKEVEIEKKKLGTVILTTEHNLTKDVTLSIMKRRINTDVFPYRLYEKAKVLGIWNPSDINFDQDCSDWDSCKPDEKEAILHLTSLFQSGEESVTNEIVPLLLAISGEKRIEEELFLTTFLFEEAKHTDFFNRFLTQVAKTKANDLDRFKGEKYVQLFDVELNNAMRILLTDPSTENQLRASVTYNMVVEGSLAETGYHAYFKMLEDHNLLPGMRKGIGLLKQDESRHIAYGIYLISRILIEKPELKPIFDEQMSRCMELVVGVIHEIFGRYEIMPFGLKADDFIEYATDQFQKRYDRIMKSLEKRTPFAEA